MTLVQNTVVRRPVQTTFDVVEGKRRRDRAIDQVADAANAAFMEKALAAVKSIASTNATLTTDEVWMYLSQAGTAMPAESRALGAVMVKAQKQGIIEPSASYRPSARPECHRRPIRIWSSKIRTTAP